jgi:hypothetical protein
MYTASKETLLAGVSPSKVLRHLPPIDISSGTDVQDHNFLLNIIQII